MRLIHRYVTSVKLIHIKNYECEAHSHLSYYCEAHSQLRYECEAVRKVTVVTSLLSPIEIIYVRLTISCAYFHGVLINSFNFLVACSSVRTNKLVVRPRVSFSANFCP